MADRFGPGHFRLGRLNEAAGVWGRRGPLLEFESIFHWKSLTTGLFCEHSKYGVSLERLPFLMRERSGPRKSLHQRARVASAVPAASFKRRSHHLEASGPGT
jgi:hypothetical protein